MSCPVCGGLRPGEAAISFDINPCSAAVECVAVAPGYFTKRQREIALSISNDHGHTAPTATVAPQPDPVNHPAHYKAGTYECREVIAALGLNFNRGSAFKYLWRAARKGRELEDLRKARACLDHEIAQLERADGTKR